MGEDKPLLVVFAGPNGSGKSTRINQYFIENTKLPGLYINADDIAKELGISPYEAAAESTRLRAEAIENRQSFVMETVLSTPEKIDFLKEAKEKGYHVHLEYVTTQSSTINVGRVSNRVMKGGHDVPIDKTISRYDKSMGLAADAAKIADTAIIYNNSFENPVRIAEKSQAKGWELFPQPPPSLWNEQKIKKLLKIDPQYKEITLNDKKYHEVPQGELREPIKGTYFGDIEHEGKKYHRIENHENKKKYLIPATEKGFERNLLLRRVVYDGQVVTKARDIAKAPSIREKIEK